MSLDPVATNPDNDTVVFVELKEPGAGNPAPGEIGPQSS